MVEREDVGRESKDKAEQGEYSNADKAWVAVVVGIIGFGHVVCRNRNDGSTSLKIRN